MAIASVVVLVAFLLLQQPSSTSSGFLSPSFSPIFDDVCNGVDCGKGTCKPSENSTFPFECECDQGWKQTLDSNNDGDMKFLPCIIPNYNACNGVNCGKGTCKLSENSTFHFECECDQGWKQTLNSNDDGALKFLPCIIPNYDVCNGVDCGKGTCKPSNSTFPFECECDQGWKQTLDSNHDGDLKFLPCIIPNYDVCKEVECGKGTCKASTNSTFSFECECDQGWKQALDSNDNGGLKFLPCIVPNCTMDYSCSKAPSPAPEKARNASDSIFDACHWVDCGGGTCKKTSAFNYTCQCDSGYYNLLNVTSFACFRQCSLGIGCSDLGISMTNSSSPPAPPPALNEDSKNEASSILQGRSLWLVLLIMVMTKIQSHWY
ncbi:uncharacterized protein [Cicer arietinum]|uniref:uncharacterized protein isoform X2 n=1 Tax=Cicer arietinum TaxID=3827 RepID=UPI003CC6B1D8